MKNAVDLLYPEWNNKVAGYVGYGFDGATRAVEQWRSIHAAVVMFTVRPRSRCRTSRTGRTASSPRGSAGPVSRSACSTRW